jgi:peptidyl-prolyl cis-trans isomerase B (cyclophilin B)
LSGKQHKRELKREREARRQAVRRRERQRNLWTVLAVGLVVAIGGALIAASLQDPDELASDLASEDPSELADEAVPPLPDVPPCEPEPAPEPPSGEAPTFPDGPEQVLRDDENYRAVIETTCGRLVYQLLEDDAPETVNSFVFLAEQGFYDGRAIFRNSTGIQILQTGSGDDTNQFDIGYQLPDEFSRAEAEGGYGPGALALAKGELPDSGGSQFFMVYGVSQLPPEYTLFGQIVEGLDVLQSIGTIPTQDPADPSNEVPSEDVVITSVTIERVPGDPLGPLAPVQPEAEQS